MLEQACQETTPSGLSQPTMCLFLITECLDGIILLNILTSHTLTWHCSKWPGLRGTLAIRVGIPHMGFCEAAAVLLLLLSAWTVSMLATKKAQQLSSARSLTQNPGASMKLGCASLAPMDVVAIEPSRSNLTSSPHRCCVCVHEIAGDYILNITCPAYIFWTTDEPRLV